MAPSFRYFGWSSYTTHQAIGMRYIVTACIFLLAGGVEALLMRLQLPRPGTTLLAASIWLFPGRTALSEVGP